MDLAKLDFRLGIAFEDFLRLSLASLVCPERPGLPLAFWLVISFGRCIFKLDTDSVGFLLQASLGRFAVGFDVTQLSDRVFRFSVFSKAVGFHIYNSKCIDRAEFRAFFNLWNHGGLNWIHEFRNFINEENANCGLFGGKKSISYADIVKLPLSGANTVPILNKKEFSYHVGKSDQARIYVFRRLGSSARNSGSRGFRRNSGSWGFPNSVIAKNKAIPMNVLHRRASSSVSYSGLNGGVHGSDHRGRTVFQNSNSNLIRPRNLQWRPILKGVCRAWAWAVDLAPSWVAWRWPICFSLPFL
jgi:hypothetical protein